MESLPQLMVRQSQWRPWTGCAQCGHAPVAAETGPRDDPARRHGIPGSGDTSRLLRMAGRGRAQTAGEARNAVEKALGDVPIEVSSETISGSAVATLVDASKTAQLLRGVRGRGRWREDCWAQWSSGLVHHAHCPVAVIHEDSATRSSTAPVVVGIDGSPASELATSIAFEEASFQGSSWLPCTPGTTRSWSRFQPLTGQLCGMPGEEILSERLAGWTERYPDVPVRRVLQADKVAHLLLEQSESAQLRGRQSR